MKLDEFKKDVWPRVQKYTMMILIMLLLAILFLRECTRPQCEECISTTDTIVAPGDTIPIISTMPKPVPIYRDTGTTKYVHLKIDTIAVVKAYLSTNYYDIVFKDDTSAYCQYRFSVNMNEVQGDGEFTFLNRRPWKTIINTTTINESKLRNRFYIGLQVNGVPGSVVTPISFGPHLLFVTKKSFAVGCSYDPFNKIATVDANWLISFRKKKK
jgi:hypothetical protein